jgi:hypothetical protein
MILDHQSNDTANMSSLSTDLQHTVGPKILATAQKMVQ